MASFLQEKKPALARLVLIRTWGHPPCRLKTLPCVVRPRRASERACPASINRRVASEIQKWGRIVKTSGATAE